MAHKKRRVMQHQMEEESRALARIMREVCCFGRDTRASVWYKRSVYKRLATTEAPA